MGNEDFPVAKSAGHGSRGLIGALYSGIMLRGMGAAFNLIAVPIVIGALGQEKFAASAALLGLAGWLTIGGAGLGSATAMTVAQYKSDQDVNRDVVWQGACSAIINVGFIIVAVLIFSRLINVQIVPGVERGTRTELLWAAYYCLASFSICTIGTIFEGIYIGRLRADYCNRVRIFAQVGAIVLVFTLPRLAPTILIVTIVMTFAPTVSAIWFMIKGCREFPPPVPFKLRLRQSLSLIKQGYGFLAVSLAILFYGGGSLPLFAATFGAAELPIASVMARIIQLYCGVIAVLHMPLGIALKNAIQLNDFRWIRKTLPFVALGLAGTAMLAAICLTKFGEQFLAMWTHMTFPDEANWLRPISVFLAVLTWALTWNYLSFATRGSLTVGGLAVAEIAFNSTIYMLMHRLVPPYVSLYIFAAVMMCISGTIVPILVWKDLRRLRSSL